MSDRDEAMALADDMADLTSDLREAELDHRAEFENHDWQQRLVDADMAAGTFRA